MPSHKPSPRRPRPPLDDARLSDLALHYVGRFATSRAKLTAYLSRKVRERGWDGPRPADPAALAERLAGLGYIDDAAFAAARGRSLGARGYGSRRVAGALRAAGIGEDDQAPALQAADAGAVEAALRFAERKRIGPFATSQPTPIERQKAIAAMLRAGHRFALAKAIAAIPPGEEIDPNRLEGLG